MSSFQPKPENESKTAPTGNKSPAPTTLHNDGGSIFSSVTGPLNVKYCDLFFILTWVLFISMILYILISIYGIAIAKGKISPLQLIITLYSIFIYILVYIIYRVFYNMCLHSL